MDGQFSLAHLISCRAYSVDVSCFLCFRKWVSCGSRRPSDNVLIVSALVLSVSRSRPNRSFWCGNKQGVYAICVVRYGSEEKKAMLQQQLPAALDLLFNSDVYVVHRETVYSLYTSLPTF